MKLTGYRFLTKEGEHIAGLWMKRQGSEYIDDYEDVMYNTEHDFSKKIEDDCTEERFWKCVNNLIEDVTLYNRLHDFSEYMILRVDKFLFRIGKRIDSFKFNPEFLSPSFSCLIRGQEGLPNEDNLELCASEIDRFYGCPDWEKAQKWIEERHYGIIDDFDVKTVDKRNSKLSYEISFPTLYSKDKINVSDSNGIAILVDLLENFVYYCSFVEKPYVKWFDYYMIMA